MAIIDTGGTYSLSASGVVESGSAFTWPSIFSYSARASRPAWDENGVVRNSPPPVVYPSSLNLQPYGVSAGKSVWQVPQGCPVCRAKLGSACAGGAKPIVRKPAATTTNATAASTLTLPKDPIERPPTPCIARYPVVCDASCRRTKTESKAAYRNNDSP